MTSVDINKWISGEIEAFFDPPATPPAVDADSNAGAASPIAQPSSRRVPYRTIVAVVAVFALVALTGFIISMRYLVAPPVEPSLAADAKPPSSQGETTSARTEIAAAPAPATKPPSSQGETTSARTEIAAAPAPATKPPSSQGETTSARTEIAAAPAPAAKPLSSQSETTSARTESSAAQAPAAAPPTAIVPAPVSSTPSPPVTHPDPQHTASLSDVGNWYDQRTKAAPLPQRKPARAQRAYPHHWSRYTSHVETDGGEATRLMVDELRQRGVAVGTASEIGDPR